MTYKDCLLAAHGHAKAMQRRIRLALDTLDDEPARLTPDDLPPMQFDPEVDDNPQNKARLRLVQSAIRKAHGG